MARPILHFSHANGFPAPCYRQFFAPLERSFRIGYIDMLGHDARYPVTDGWPHLVAELVDAIRARYREPVIGVGHSLGAMVTFMAAVQRPELFRAIVMLDAPIIGRWKGTAFRMIKQLGLVDRVTPAAVTRQRRREWPDRAAALAHFRKKPLFRDFAPDCLADYIRFGLKPDRGRVRLAFDPAIEYAIYRTIPHDLADYLPRLAVAAGMIVGRSSDVVRRVGLAESRARFVIRRIAGGHLFPFEHPQAAAGTLVELVAALLPARPGRRARR